MKYLAHAACLCVLTSLAPITGSSADELTPDRFRELHQELQADDGQLWRTIAWQTDLLAAQRQAAQERKPIFIWAMDGHPLGCT